MLISSTLIQRLGRIRQEQVIREESLNARSGLSAQVV
jgi:hypothetical protein